MTNLQQLDAYFSEHREAHLNELNEFYVFQVLVLYQSIKEIYKVPLSG